MVLLSFYRLTLSVPVVFLNSPNQSPYFLLNKFERIWLLIFSSWLCLINSHFLITKCHILYVLYKEKLVVDSWLALKGLSNFEFNSLIRLENWFNCYYQCTSVENLKSNWKKQREIWDNTLSRWQESWTMNSYCFAIFFQQHYSYVCSDIYYDGDGYDGDGYDDDDDDDDKNSVSWRLLG